MLQYSAALFTALLVAILSACTVGPKYHPAVVQAPEVYKESPTQFKEDQTWTVAQPSDTMLRGKWWEIFNDPELNALEEQLNINNQNIKQFFENFMAARALVREAHAQYFPTITVVPSVTHSRTPAKTFSSAATGTGNSSSGALEATNYTLPFEGSWAPDLWGKVRNTVHQQQYAAELSAADLENERLTEQASLAQFFFEIRGQDMLQQIFNETVAADQKSLDLTKTLYDLGIDGQIAVVQAQTTLESAQAGATNVGIARAQFEHAIAMLIGKDPSNFSIPVKPMTTAPPPIPVGVPSQLLQRRPDIAAAERAMAVANAQIGIAYAAFYPNLTLTGQGGFQSSRFGSWLSWPSRFWSVGASVSQPLFDAGLRRATVQQYVATYNADLAAYRQTVLVAFQQVEDTLAEVRILSQQVQQQQAALKSAQTFLQLEQARYETGIDPYINVLVAQNTALANAQTLNAIQVQEMTASVALIEALGGGWDRSQLPDPSQVTQKPDKADSSIQQERANRLENVTIEEVNSPERLRLARDLFEEYWTSIGFGRQTFGFGGEVDSLPGAYARPEGRLAIAVSDGQPVGCVALRRFDEHSGEMKRLFVRQAARGQGVAGTLLEWLVSEARAQGYTRILADTLPTMGAALRLYERLGFRRIEAYSPTPTPGAIYLEMDLH